MNIRTYAPELEDELKKIFFTTASIQEFASNESKENFYYKYLGYYLKNYPDYTFVAVDSGKVLGYIALCPDSANDQNLLQLNPQLQQYANHYNQFPAHLHINISPISQGMGVGTALIQHARKQLRAMQIHGLHLITMGNARNVDFYSKNGFMRIADYQDGTVLMGQNS